MGTDDYQIYHGDHFIMYLNVESQCCIPETNITLYVNQISIKKKKTHPLKKPHQCNLWHCQACFEARYIDSSWRKQRDLSQEFTWIGTGKLLRFEAAKLLTQLWCTGGRIWCSEAGPATNQLSHKFLTCRQLLF